MFTTDPYKNLATKKLRTIEILSDNFGKNNISENGDLI